MMIDGKVNYLPLRILPRSTLKDEQAYLFSGSYSGSQAVEHLCYQADSY